MARGRPTLEDDQEALLARVPDDGTSIGNTALRTDLGWTEERYYRARNLLVDSAQLLLGRGRGGSVKRVVVEPAAPGEVRPEVPRQMAEISVPRSVVEASYPEDALYDPIARVLQSEFVQEQRLQQAWFEVTARQGRRSTGGKWTRPDIAGASVRRFKYLTGIHLDVWTFEVKPRGACDVSGVFEAAAHSRAATRSCVLFHQPEFEDDERARVVHEAQRLGIGLIEFIDPANYDTWEIIVPPIRRQPEPEAVEEFIEVQLSQEIKDNILRAKG